jgi:hypothetical protein
VKKNLELPDIIEYDIRMQQALTRQRIFRFSGFNLKSMKTAKYPVTSFAILVHDYPIQIENHPLPAILKQLF